MAERLRLLLLEDRPSDAGLILDELRRAGFDLDWRQVDSEVEYLNQLSAEFDVILADYAMPQFDALQALHLLRERGLEIPLIIVSGSIGEETAVKAIQNGAADYLLKDRLGRLGQAVQQVLQQSRLRRESRRAEQSLRETNEKLRSLVQVSPLAIIALDPQSRVQAWNPAAERIFGWTEEEVVGRFAPYVGESEREEFQNLMAHSIAGGGQEGIDWTARRKDGSPIETRFWTTPLCDALGTVTSIYGFYADVTQERRLESQVRQSQKMEAVGRLAGGIAHDFNNLLTIIMGYGALALARLSPDDPRHGDLVQINYAAERAAMLTRQLLAFSRKQVLNRTVLNLNTLLAEMERLLIPLIGEDVDLVFNLEPKLWPIAIDAGQMEQVVMNLAVNARDALPQGGKLIMETANVLLDEFLVKTHSEISAGDYVRLTVSDNGCGMTETVRTQIFEPFFTTKAPDQGTGLGLSTVYGIVKQSGGHIEVQSEPAAGTTFKLFFPRERKEVSAKKSDAERTIAPHGTETILLVEDEAEVRRFTKRVLEENGYKLLEAPNGSEALKTCRQYPTGIDLVITDVIMPNMSGRQLVEQLLAVRPKIRVLYISGYTDEAVIRHGVFGADVAFLQKPFTSRVLIDKVRQVLDQSSTS